MLPDSLRPHGPEHTRFHCPWDFPGKNTGVGFHSFSKGSSQPRGWTKVFCIGKQILYHCKSESESHSVVSDSLRPCGLYSPWNSPGQNTGVGSLSFLQGIFPTQGSNPGLLHCRWVLYQLSHKGSPWATWERLMLGDCKWYQIPGSEHLLINQMKECMVHLCEQLDMGHCKTQSCMPGNPRRGWPLGWGMGLTYFCLSDTHRQRIAVG